LADGGFVCHCPPHYTGERCETPRKFFYHSFFESFFFKIRNKNKNKINEIVRICGDFPGLHGIYFPVSLTGDREGNETFLERIENIDFAFGYNKPPIGSPYGAVQ